METNDVELTVQKALEKFPEAKPRIISKNGSQLLSKNFAEFLAFSGLRHVRTSVNYPPANGKIERYQRTLSEECLRRTPLIELSDARREIADYVSRYSHERPHASLFYLTPSDLLEGRVKFKSALREDWLKQARETRVTARNQIA